MRDLCCRVFQSAAACCSVLQYVFVCERARSTRGEPNQRPVLQCVAVCCSVLQCVAVCCSVLQCVVVYRSVVQCGTVWCSVLQCVAVCCSVLQCVAVCCSVLQCIAVHCCALRVYQQLQHPEEEDGERDRKQDGRQLALSYTTTHCNTLQHTAIYCNTLQHTATQFSDLVSP